MYVGSVAGERNDGERSGADEVKPGGVTYLLGRCQSHRPTSYCLSVLCAGGLIWFSRNFTSIVICTYVAQLYFFDCLFIICLIVDNDSIGVIQ